MGRVTGAGSLRLETINDGAFTVTVPVDWRIRRKIDFESDEYFVSLGGKTLFVIVFENNPAMDQLQKGNRPKDVMVSGNDATEYRDGTGLTHLLVKPTCGKSKYVLLRVVSRDIRHRAAISKAMMSIACTGDRRATVQ